jgi:hypothetical protein
MDGIVGARIWCGHGILAHNLVKISGLIEASRPGEAHGDPPYHPPMTRVQHYEPSRTPLTAMDFMAKKLV